MYKFRYLDPADAERWPGWHEVDMGAPHDMDSGVLLEWEDATGYRILDTSEDSPTNIAEAAKRREMRALLAVHWLAVRLGGDRTPWEQFRPKVLQVEYPPELEAEAKQGNPGGPATRATRRARSASEAEASPRARKAAPRRSAS